MLTQDKSLKQVKAHQSQYGIINPSREITTDDELYLRDYTLAAAVISWDRGTYNTPAQLTPAQITNIAITGDTVWYQLDFHHAIPLDIETFHSHRLHLQQEQPTGFAGDSVSCQLRPKPEAIAQYEQGLQHGRNDADQRLHPIYAEASCEYSKGYLQGYKGRQASHQVEVAKALQWAVTYNDRWQWYTVWVGDRAIGRASTHEEAERIGQKYIAARQFWQEHRGRVLAAFAD